MRSALVNMHLVRDSGCAELGFEFAGLLRRGGCVGARDQQQQTGFHLRDERFAACRPPIETDASVEIWVKCGLVPRIGAAEAKPDGEDGSHRTAFRRPQVRNRRAHVSRDVLVRGLFDVRHVFKGLAPITNGRCSAEVIDRHRVGAGLRKSNREVLVELMQAAHVRHHHHAGAGRLLCACEVTGEPRPVRGCQDKVALVRGRAADWRKRRSRLIAVAHTSILA